jgi:hypothetical protein
MSLENAHLLVNVNPTLLPHAYIAVLEGTSGGGFEFLLLPHADQKGERGSVVEFIDL